MTTRTWWLLGWLATAVLPGCATDHPQPAVDGGTATPQMRSGSNELRAYQLVEWIAPDDRTLIVSSVNRSLYQARFKGRCTGLRQVDTLAFIVQTPPQVEKYEGVILPSGTRCAFASMTKLQTGTAAAKDGSATENP